MTFIPRLFPCIALPVLVLIGAGCATPEKKEAGKEVAKTVAFREYTLQELRDELALRQRQIRTLSGNVSAEWSSRLAPGGKQSMTGVFAFEMPDKIRMSLGKPLTSFSVDLVSDGDRFWLANHAQKTVHTGKCETVVGTETEKIPFRPQDIVDAYFIRELTDRPGFTKRITFYECIGNYYIVSVLRDDFTNLLYSKVWVDRFSSNVVRHQLYDAEKGTIRVDALLGQYETVGGVSVPHEMVISWPNQLSTLTVKFKGVKVNPKWDNPKIFIFDATKPNYAYVDLDESAKTEQDIRLRERRPGMVPVPGYPPQSSVLPSQTPSRAVQDPFGLAPRKPTASPSGDVPVKDYVPPPNPYGAKKPRPAPTE